VRVSSTSVTRSFVSENGGKGSWRKFIEEQMEYHDDQCIASADRAKSIMRSISELVVLDVVKAVSSPVWRSVCQYLLSMLQFLREISL